MLCGTVYRVNLFIRKENKGMSYLKKIRILFFIFMMSNSSCYNVSNVPVVTNKQSASVTPTNPITTSPSCWPITQNMESVKGSFIYKDRDNKHAFAWDISSFHTRLLRTFPDELLNSSNFSVSPDGNIVAGLSDDNKIFFISNDQIKFFQLPDGHYSYIKYLSNEEIYIPISDESLINYQEDKGLTDRYVIFDPAKDELTAYSVFLPNLLIASHNLVALQYSPDMRYAVYLTGYDQFEPQFTLFDLIRNKIVWTGPKTPVGMAADADRMPVWKPDSSTLTYSFITDQENFGNYFSISIDGDLTKLTQFEKTEMMGLNMGVLANPSWSPDGRYLMFKVAQGSDGPIRLFIWDDQKKTAFMPCLPDEAQIDVGYIGDWSFDGSYFFITLGYPNKNPPDGGPLYVRYNTVILDMGNKTIFELPDQDHRGEYTSLYGGSQNEFIGWVNWAIP